MNKGTSKHIAIATAAVVSVGAFGVGAISLAQANPDFNPDNFTSAYSKGLDDADKGYQANPVDTDGQANRNKENADDNGKSTEGKQNSQDAFSSTPQQGPSGTTAYNITGNVNQGGLTIANGNSTNNAGGASNNGSNATNGPVITPTDNPGGNGNGNGNENNNGGNANNGGSGDNNNGNGGAGGNTDPTPTPTPTPTPWQPSYIDPVTPELPFDPTPNRKPSTALNSDPINNSNTKLSEITRDNVFDIIIQQTAAPEYQLYTGQQPDKWTVFCGLAAYFTYFYIDRDGNPTWEEAEWRCSKDEFDTYPYFKIVSCPKEIPNEEFDVVVAYRINVNDEWTEESVHYTPAPSRTYILGTKLDENGNNNILFSYANNDINLFLCSHSLMRDTGYLQSDGTLSQLLLSWQEYGKDVDFFYQPTTTGRHLLAPGRFVDIPNGFTMKLKNRWMLSDYTVVPITDNNGKACSLQTLTAVSPAADCMLLPDRSGRITLSTSPGIQAIDIEAEPVTVDRLEASGSVWYINTENDLLRVNDSYSVSSDNPNYANLANGILTNKQKTAYVGIPLNFKTLDVAEEIESINFAASNKLNHVTLNVTDENKLPNANWENLENCNVLVDDEVFDEFATAHQKEFDVSTGNTISMKSDPNTRYCFSNGTLISRGKAVHFIDTGVDLVRVTDANTLTTGCLENCPSITTLVLTNSTPYFFENGCLAASNVRTIVCSTDEQVEYVYSRLQAAGAGDDVYVTKAVTTDEGYRFFDNIDDLGLPAVTIFEVPDSIHTFNGVGHIEGYPLAFSTIAPATFKNHPNLAWCNLADSIDHVGADAFSGCSKLQGVFFSNTNAITVGKNAFENCESMRFIASNAITGNFETSEMPNENCLMYCPTNCIGYHEYFTMFDEQSGVTSYAVDEQEDGSLVLSGCDEERGRWLLLAAGGEMNGEIKLSTDVLIIFDNAFANTKGDFTINWTELDKLQSINDEAFLNSTVAGDIYFGPCSYGAYYSLGKEAFRNCPNITSFTSEAPYLITSEIAFENCTSLEHVTLGITGDNYNAILPGMFSGCSNLKDIEFTGWTPVGLTLIGADSLAPFLFDSGRSFEEEEAALRLNVPEYCQETYLESWLYPMIGTADFSSYFKVCYSQLLKENNDIIPTDFEVMERMSQGMLVAENHLRTMMGMPLVDHSSFLDVKEKNGFEFERQNNVYMLTVVPDDATVVDFNDIIPDGIDSVGIGANVFAKCTGLKRVVLTDKVSAISMNAFAGRDGVEVELPETVNASLLGGEWGEPYTFGADVKLIVPEGAEADYLPEWTRQCLGIVDGSADSMDAYAATVLVNTWDIFSGNIEDYPATVEELNVAVNTPLMEAENYLRGLMGLAPISSLEELSCYYDASDVYELYKPNPEPDPDPWPDWPDLPEWPDWGDSDLSGDFALGGNSAGAANESDAVVPDSSNAPAAKKEDDESNVSADTEAGSVADDLQADAAANIVSNVGTAAETDATNVATLSAIENQSEQAADNSAPIAEMPA